MLNFFEKKKRKITYKVLQVVVDPKLHNLIKEYCNKNFISMSSYIKSLIVKDLKEKKII